MVKVVLFVVVFVISNPISGSFACAEANIPASQFVSLYDLYQFTNGSHWTWRNESLAGNIWNFTSSTANPCFEKWQGINCSTSEPLVIVEVNLASYRLEGFLSDSLGYLVNLTKLDLSGNVLQGVVPSTLGNLVNLQYLEFSNNTLNGTIPTSAANLCQLQHYGMQNNYMNSSIPEIFTCMRDLKFFNVHNNEFSGSIPRSLCGLRNLSWLALDTNAITGHIPPCLGNITSLQGFTIFINQITGPVPNTVGNLVNMEYLYIAFNGLTGTLPSSLGNMRKLRYLNSGTNKLTGTLPPSMGQWTQLQQLLLYDNGFTGSVPDTFGNFSELLLLILSGNRLHGALPASLGKLTRLEYIDLGSNHLTGPIPDSIEGWQQMKIMYLLQNYFSGALPATVGQLWRLQELKLYSNKLSGQLPESIQQMGNLSALLLYDNHLSGNLHHVFNATLHISLSTVQISNNELTGALPTELFRLPALLTVVAVGNCFTGALPENICNATNLRTIALDGLRSAANCRKLLIPGVSSAYQVAQPWSGTLPSCLLSMPLLTTLHLSGNGYTGTIPTVGSLGSTLTGMSLPHNRFTGTIPQNIQQRPWNNLDLSYNRLSGTLSESFAAQLQNDSMQQLQEKFPQTQLTLDNNRLSGRIPHSIVEIANIRVLSSNRFSCRIDRTDLPQHDRDRGNYQCGSSSFNVPFFTWLGLICAAAVVGWVVVLRYRNVSVEPGTATGSMGELASTFLAWLQATDANMVQYQRFLHILKGIVLVNLKVLCYILALLCPLYVCLSIYFGTVKYQSAYIVSAGFLSGKLAVALLFVALVVLVLIFALLYVAVLDDSANSDNSERLISVVNNTRPTRERFAVYAAFLLINFTFVIAVNASYVYVALYESGNALLVVQVLLSFFKLFWNKVCGSYLVRYISNYISGFERSAVELYSKKFMSIQLVVTLFNNIAIPCLVVAVVSPNCFNNAFVTAPKVRAAFEYVDCTTGFTTATDSCTPVITTGNTEYDAPFAYNYQCSATFVTYYAPAFVYLCVTASFLQPIASVVTFALYQRANTGSLLHRYLSYLIPRLFKLPLLENPPVAQRDTFKPIFDANSAMTSVFSLVGILMTFGAVFPPLALALSFTLVSTALFSKAAVGRVILWARAQGADSYLNVIELECREMTNLVLLRNSLRILVVAICWFYTLFLFDTLGDAVGFDHAYWVLIVMPLIPLGFWVCFRIYERAPWVIHSASAVSATGVELQQIAAGQALHAEEATINVLVYTC